MFTDNEKSQANEILDICGINSTGDLFAVKSDSCGIYAACFTKILEDHIIFDIVVLPTFQGQGIAKLFIEDVIKHYKDNYNKFLAQCINPAMSHILEKYFNFNCVAVNENTKVMLLER